MQLQRTLGWKEATSLGIGAMVGAGIFVLSGVAQAKQNLQLWSHLF
ncbi:hypothetical protein RCG24_11505 [Neobacillus sp. OS1-32]|jgi:amino acid transporter|nr:hypothetical protein [Neobacillus sp. OS1-32]WML28673.1 hypothetical protein RCG24_11505 [Neobacillus sp. OS1-32]